MDLSRRDFLKLGAAAMAGLATPTPGRARAARPLPPDDASQELWGLGRVAYWRLSVRAAPDGDADRVAQVYQDDVLPILAAVEGGPYPAHNRIWYDLGDGYLHSSWVQPVAYDYQTPLRAWPGKGFLAQVSVPFVDARRTTHRLAAASYRLYFGAAFWVTDVQPDAQGDVWYRVWDERELRAYFVPGEAMRRVPEEELAPISPQVPPGDKWLHVDTQQQVVVAYEGTGAVLIAPTATGAWFLEDGEWKDYTTTPGTYRIERKMPTRHMAGGDPSAGSGQDLAAEDGFDLPGVPWVSYFSPSGMAFHGTYWHNDYGQPRSHGCVNVTPEIALWIYRWTTPPAPPDEDVVWATDQEGTLVEVI